MGRPLCPCCAPETGVAPVRCDLIDVFFLCICSPRSTQRQQQRLPPWWQVCCLGSAAFHRKGRTSFFLPPLHCTGPCYLSLTHTPPLVLIVCCLRGLFSLGSLWAPVLPRNTGCSACNGWALPCATRFSFSPLWSSPPANSRPSSVRAWWWLNGGSRWGLAGREGAGGGGGVSLRNAPSK